MAASKVVKMAKRYLHGTIASDNQFRTPKLILLGEPILYLENDMSCSYLLYQLGTGR